MEDNEKKIDGKSIADEANTRDQRKLESEKNSPWVEPAKLKDTWGGEALV